MNISTWIQHHSQTTPHQIALTFEGESITYSQLEERIAGCAGVLRDTLNIQFGHRVAYLGENSPELLVLFFACCRIGALFVPLNARMTVSQHQYFLDNCDPVCFFVEDAFQDHASKCLSSDSAIQVITFGHPLAQHTDHILMSDLLSQTRPFSDCIEHPADTPAMIAYTSGSTGLPKGAVLNQEMLFYVALNAAENARMTSDDHILTNLPMFHVGGLTVHTLPAIYCGASVTIHRTFTPESTLLEIEQSRITVFLPLPKMSRALASHPNWHKTDLSSLRLTQTGSTFVPTSVMSQWTKRNIPAQQMYGSTEAPPPVLSRLYNDSLCQSTSMGKPSMYSQARIVDNHMQDVHPGERGELILKGPIVFKEYWRNPKATAQSFTDGWFHTGDVVHQDNEGLFYMDDRQKHIIIVGSSNVYPADLESVLSECDDIAESAVVGRPDEELGEVPVACVQLKDGRRLSAKTIQNLFKDKLANYQHPKEIIFVDSFPRTSLGKIQKTEVTEMIRNRVS